MYICIYILTALLYYVHVMYVPQHCKYSCPTDIMCVYVRVFGVHVYKIIRLENRIRHARCVHCTEYCKRKPVRKRSQGQATDRSIYIYIHLNLGGNIEYKGRVEEVTEKIKNAETAAAKMGGGRYRLQSERQLAEENLFSYKIKLKKINAK